MSAFLLTLLKYLIINDLFVISCRRFSPFFTSYFPMQNVYLPTQTIFVLRKSLYINGELFE